jgi:hypothetical protein
MMGERHITAADLAPLGLHITTLVQESDGSGWAEIDPDSITLDVAALLSLFTKLGCTDVIIEFEPAKAWDSCFNPEEITIRWRRG